MTAWPVARGPFGSKVSGPSCPPPPPPKSDWGRVVLRAFVAMLQGTGGVATCTLWTGKY